jgi:mono/diheme cytochrome c family protein
VKPILRLSLLFGVLSALAAIPAHAQSLPAGVTPDMIKKGDQIFHGTGLCFACHGADAKGTVGPDLTDQVWIHSKGTYEEIIKTVTDGIPLEATKLGKGPMPPKGGSSISDDDVKAVAAYVWSLSHTGG